MINNSPERQSPGRWRWTLVIFGLALAGLAAASPWIGAGDREQFFLYPIFRISRRECALLGLGVMVLGALMPLLARSAPAFMASIRRFVVRLRTMEVADILEAARRIPFRASSADVANRFDEFSGFHPRLQSLRGLAALMVAVGHSFILFERLQVYNAETLHLNNAAAFLMQLVFQADTAVIFFFVLSGFVLGQSIRAVPAGNPVRIFGAFTAKRLGRLLPLYWLSVVLVYGYLVLSPRQPYGFASGWFNQLFPESLSWHLLGLNLVALDTSINPILWSIQAELAMIFLLPALTGLVSRAALWINIAVIGLAFFVTCLSVLPRCLSYVFCFHIGILLPVIAGHWRLKTVLSNRWAFAAALAGLFVAEALHRLGHYPFTPWVNQQLKYLIDSGLSLMIIASVLLRPDLVFMRFLDRCLIVALGTASYGFYVIHIAVMDVMARCWFDASPGVAAAGSLEWTLLSLAIAVLSTILTFMIASMLYRLIELPGIRVGRDIAGKISNPVKRPTASA